MNSNTVLFVYAVISIPAILAGGFFSVPWYFIMPISLAPLGLYWYDLYRRDSLNQQQIDSVYYFGFLLTLAFLLASVVEFTKVDFSSTEPKKVTEIAAKFALGLIATGIGLAGRLFLLPKKFSLETTDDAIQKQIQQVDNLVFEFQKTIDLFQQLREEALNRTTRGVEQAAIAVVDTIKSGLEVSVASLSASINQLKTDLSSLDVSTLESLAKTSSRLSKSFDQLSSSVPDTSVVFQSLHSNLQVLTVKTEAAGTALARNADSAERASTALERLDSLDSGALESINKSLTDLSESLSRIDTAPLVDLLSTTSATSSSLDHLRELIPDLGSSVESLGSDVDSLAKTAVSASQSLETLKSSISSIGGSVESIRQLETVTQEISSAMTKFSQNIALLDKGSIEQLGSTIESILVKFKEFETLIQGMRTAADQSINTVAGDIQQSSANISQQIAELDRVASVLQTTMAKYSQALRAMTVKNFGS